MRSGRGPSPGARRRWPPPAGSSPCPRTRDRSAAAGLVWPELPTLEARVEWEICHECGWEDDGQDDLNADEVWGGPNGSDSLTDARLRYARYIAAARAKDSRSVANGGQGSWFEACLAYRASRHLPERFAASPTAVVMPNTTEQPEASTSGDLHPLIQPSA
ncbi:CPCC family cysteine-rich protein [Streptomyces sp. NPDC088358]|uniref:CPCC family cysteine-rich protein n=1 Tax=Streptomyces sp. NPDC088358 TaxID=3365857 RepID=UPI003813D7AD